MGEDFAILLEGSRVHFNPTKLKKGSKQQKNIEDSLKGLTFN